MEDKSDVDVDLYFYRSSFLMRYVEIWLTAFIFLGLFFSNLDLWSSLLPPPRGFFGFFGSAYREKPYFTQWATDPKSGSGLVHPLDRQGLAFVNNLEAVISIGAEARLWREPNSMQLQLKTYKHGDR